MIKPKRLRAGDTIAVVSPSWGGPGVFPHVFDLGLRTLREEFGLRIVEYPTARASVEYLHVNPKARADDLNRAFADPNVHAVIASIGGDDSVRILPYLDVPTILANPNILLGYSDTSTLHTYLNQNGLVTFNGPSVLAGFAQARHLPAEFLAHVRALLFEPTPTYTYLPYLTWVNRYQDWNTPGYDGETEPPRPNDEQWRWLQGAGTWTGRLFGGCLDVLEMMKGTRFWPAPDTGFWDDRVFFLETSEDKPGIDQVTYALRNYGMQGVFDHAQGLLFGRARDYSPDEKARLYETLVAVVSGEFGRADLPIVANLDFGHTDPQFILPLGIRAELNCDSRTFRLLEPAVL